MSKGHQVVHLSDEAHANLQRLREQRGKPGGVIVDELIREAAGQPMVVPALRPRALAVIGDDDTTPVAEVADADAG